MSALQFLPDNARACIPCPKPAEVVPAQQFGLLHCWANLETNLSFRDPIMQYSVCLVYKMSDNSMAMLA